MPTKSNAMRIAGVPALSWDDCRLLVESVVDYAIFMLDTEGHVATWNLGAEKIKGYSADEIVGQHFSKFFTEEDVQAGKPQRELETAAADGRFEDESWRVRKDGTRFWANVVITALRNEKGELRGFGKVTRDLTVRREAEEQLRRAEQRFHAAEEATSRVLDSEERYKALSQRLEIVLEGVADGITVQDRTGQVVYANTAAARICGFNTAAELVATRPADVVARYDIFDAEGNPFPVEKLPARQVLAGEKNEGSAVLHIRERATRRDWWVLIRASAVLDSNGRPDLAINIWHDVTAERREERRVKYLAEVTSALGSTLDADQTLTKLARALVPDLGDWCSIYLLEGRSAGAPSRLREVTRAHRDPEKGHAHAVEEYRRRFPPDPSHAGIIWRVVRSGKAEVFNDITPEVLTRSTNDPEALTLLRALRMTAAVIVPIRAGHDHVLGAMALVSASVDRRYEADDVALIEEAARRAGVALENARLYQAAQESARAAEMAGRAKDEFLATVSHELRTPLNAILGWASMLRQRPLDSATAKPLEVIYRNAQAQAKIIEDILDVSRIITGKLRIEPKPTDLVAVAGEAIEVVRPSADAKGLKIEFEAPASGPCLIVADSERLQQVAWNLLSNAVKFTDRGSITVAVRQEGSKVTLTVSDTGKGIPSEFMPFMFDRFRQADSSITRRMGGLGLGLALVRHIVELHGGRVAVTSDGPGKGAAFKVTLPVRAILPTSPQSAASATDDPSKIQPAEARDDASSTTTTTTVPALNGIRVLVVDDEADARDLLQAVLVESGAIVATARSAFEGLELLQRFRPDVLVSDVGMPDEDGYAFLRKVRSLPARNGGAVPAIALTAYAREEDRVRAISVGFMTHLTKPVDPEALLFAVGNLALVNNRST